MSIERPMCKGVIPSAGNLRLDLYLDLRQILSKIEACHIAYLEDTTSWYADLLQRSIMCMSLKTWNLEARRGVMLRHTVDGKSKKTLLDAAERRLIKITHRSRVCSARLLGVIL